MLNEPLDESSGILLAKRAAKPEAISFETVVPVEVFLLYRGWASGLFSTELDRLPVDAVHAAFRNWSTGESAESLFCNASGSTSVEILRRF
jgi:hypothetical protein